MSDSASAAREMPPGREVPAAGEAGTRPPASGGFRPDVQGLRALAVGMVVIYHLPNDKKPFTGCQQWG